MSPELLKKTARALTRALRSRSEKKLDGITDFLAAEYGRRWPGMLDRLCDIAAEMHEISNPEAETAVLAVLTGRSPDRALAAARDRAATFARF